MNIFDGVVDAKLAYVPVLEDANHRNISPGERGALAYLQFMIYEAEYFRNGDILIHDGEPALCTPTVDMYLRTNGIQPFTLPSALHQFLSPLDNNFHSTFKLSYYRLISDGNYSEIDAREKLSLAQQCYAGICSPEVVRNLFVTCGLIGDGEKREVVARLMNENLKALGGRNDFHKKNLLLFLKWCLKNDLGDELCPIDIDYTLW